MPEKKLPPPKNPLTELWRELIARDVAEITKQSGACRTGEIWELSAIGQHLLIDTQSRNIIQRTSQEPAPFLLQLLVLHYMLKAQELPLAGRLVNPHEFTGGDFFFRGPHGFNVTPLEEKFGQDPKGFLQAGKLMGGQPLKMGDAGFNLPALPRIPLTYLLWCADEEFPAQIKVLFDATAESQLPLDMLWTLVNLTNKHLLKYPA